MPKLHDLESHRAFLALLDTLRESAEHAAEESAEIDLAETLRNVLHLLSAGIDFYLEGDPERPEFVRIVTPTRKFLGDNPDAIYHFARIRGDRAYRISGAKQDACYVSFTIHGRSCRRKARRRRRAGARRRERPRPRSSRPTAPSRSCSRPRSRPARATG